MTESIAETSTTTSLDSVLRTAIRVLHVDDEAGFLKAAKQVLEMQGAFQVETASSVEEAEEKIRHKSYDVIVSDYVMPGKTGLDFLKELRESGNNIPFIIFTGRGREIVAIKALNLGADQYVNKIGTPEVVYSELAHGIRKLVKTRRVEEKVRESEEKYRNLFENAKDVIILLDLKGNITAINKAAVEYGFKKDEVIGRNMRRFVSKKYWPRLLKELVQLTRGKTVEGKIEIITPKGRKDAEYRSDPMIVDNRVVGVQGVLRDVTYRKKAEEELIRLSSTAKMTTDSIVISDLDAKIIDVNEATLRMYGTDDKKDLIGKNSYDLIAPEDRDRALAGTKETLEKGYVKGREYNIITKDGDRVPVEMSVAIMKDVDVKPTGFVGISRDITERKKREEELRRSEQRLKVLFEYAPDAYYLSDLKGNFVDGNRAAEELTGRSRSELIGKSFLKLKLLPRSQISKAAKLLVKNALGKPTGPDEFILNRKDGTQVSVEIRTYPVKIKRQTLVLGIARDITERKKAEKTLKQSEEKYRGIVELAPDGIATMNMKGVVISVNSAFLRLTGFSKDELVGKHFTKIGTLRARDLPRYIKLFGSIVRGKIPPPMEFAYLRKDGTQCWGEAHSGLLKEGGKTVGFQAILRDTTGRKKTLEKLKMLNEKLSVVGKLTRHDARNKLSTVTMNTFLTKQKLAHGPEALKHLSEIESACGEVEGIFEFARIYEKIGLEELAYMNVEKTLEETVRLFSDLHDVKIANDCHGLTILADSLLSQLLYNLIDNSLKHCEKVSRIRVYYQEAGKDQLKLVYEDDGVGIPKVEKERIFGEGYGKGTGHGLYLIRKMCEVYGWTIHETGKYGKGAQFTMIIPKTSVRVASRPPNQTSY